jgi:hypothetical protein
MRDSHTRDIDDKDTLLIIASVLIFKYGRTKKHFRIKSMASGEAFGKSSSRVCVFGGGKLSSIVAAKGDFMCSMSLAVGAPVTSKIRSS